MLSHDGQRVQLKWRCTQVGRRGAPAKGVGRDNRRGGSNPLISAKKDSVDFSTESFFRWRR